MRLRRAQPDDAPRLLAAKTLLRVQVAPDTAAAAGRGGFLLGSTLEQYRTFIDRDLVWVLACGNDRRTGGCREHGAGSEHASTCPGIAGFAIVLPWSTLRLHRGWNDRSSFRVTDEQALARVENGSGPAYYEQLAVLPHGRDLAAALALRALDSALADHDTVLATTVRRPWHNRAALPLLRAAGFVSIGEIDETYDQVGQVMSTVHLLERPQFHTASSALPPALTARLRSAGQLDVPAAASTADHGR